MKTEITLPGRPITKKNRQQIIYNKRTGKPQVIQSRPYRQYEEACLWQLKAYRGLTFGKKQVSLRAEYYMPNKRSWPDLLGLLQATADILEKAGIYEDDRQIVSFDGSRIAGVDRDNPRVDIEIEEVE